jgi:hypothetical protein
LEFVSHHERVGVKRGNGKERTGGTGKAETEKRVKRGKEGKTFRL